MKDLLVLKADKLAHQVYNISKSFPHGELFGITSQLRRSSISIVLNLIEGFARSKNTEYLHYLEIAYGSLKETKYLLYFSYKENYLKINHYNESLQLSEEIGKMIWERMKRMRNKMQKKKS